MRAILVFLLALPVVVSAQKKEIEWLSLNQAEKKMEKEPRQVLIDVYTHWCGPCKMMNKTTFRDPDVVDYISKNFYAVKFNAESPDTIRFKGNIYKNAGYDPNRRGRNTTHDLTKAIAPVNGRIAYPTIVFLEKSFKIIAPVQGYRKPRDMKSLLKYINNEVYAEDVGYQEYLKKQN